MLEIVGARQSRPIHRAPRRRRHVRAASKAGPVEVLPTPFRIQGPEQNPAPLAYLNQTRPNNYNLELEISLRAAGMNTPASISHTNFKYMYWSSVQQLMHHASSGCAMNVGDLLGSGTISGPEKNQRGSLLEISWNGTEPVELPGGAKRSFLEDGDSLVMRGWCQGDGYRVGFGEVEGTIVPAE